jgi:hypothetical protein
MRWIVVLLLALAGCPGPEPVCQPASPEVLVIEFPAGGGPPVVSAP